MALPFRPCNMIFPVLLSTARRTGRPVALSLNLPDGADELLAFAEQKTVHYLCAIQAAES